MNSSISSSDPRALRRFLALLIGTAAGALVLIWAFLLAVDPYDVGHGLFSTRGTAEGGPRTANASRARDPSFNAAIIGNSHAQMLSPEALDGATGLSFVQLTIPGTGPTEQLVLLDYFVRRQGGNARALVIGTDQDWCAAEARHVPQHPFPFWLYDDNPLVYAGNLLRGRALRSAFQRLTVVADWRKADRRDGHWDYSGDYPARQGESPAWLNVAEAMRRPGYWNASGRFPRVEMLREKLAALPPDMRTVLLVPPIHASGLPVSGSADARAERACVAALVALAQARPNTSLVDLRRDIPATRETAHFHDMTHYSAALARIVETQVANALKGLGP